MDCKAIVFDGYVNPSSWNNLKDYFIRQYKNAQKNENYSINEFFDECIEEVVVIEDVFTKKVIDEKKELLQVLEYQIKVNDNDGIKRVKGRLKEVKREEFTVNLNSYFDNKYKGTLYYEDLQYLKKTIEEARLSFQPKGKAKPTNIEPLNFDLNQSEVIYLFDILQEATFLLNPSAHSGSYYRKLEKYFTANKTHIKDAEQKRNKFLEKPLSSSQIIKEKLLEAIKKMPY